MNAMPQQTDLEDFTGMSVDLFSYAALSREDEVAAKEDAAIIKAHMKSAAESIIAVGLALKRQKERLPHGMFLPWIEAEFGMSNVTASRMMNVAEIYGGKSFSLKDFTKEALYELAAPSTPQSVREQVEELIVDGQKVTAADIRKMKAEAKATEELAEARAKLATLQKKSDDKDLENAGEIHNLQIQIETLERGATLHARTPTPQKAKLPPSKRRWTSGFPSQSAKPLRRLKPGLKMRSAASSWRTRSFASLSLSPLSKATRPK
ncbi:hypothetical protein DEA98_10215 [Brucella pseudogrignonensis]|nr:hypothetical protein [Brucella pseudogrignonensis]